MGSRTVFRLDGRGAQWLLGSAFLVALILMAPACSDTESGSGDLSASERQEIAAEIEDRNRDLLEVWAQEDAFDEWMELYVDDEHSAWAEDPFMLTVSGNTFESRQEMDEAFREVLADRTTQVTMEDESVAVLSSDLAIHFGDFTWTLTRDGETSDEYAAQGTTVWVKEGDEWKILTYHQSWPSTTPVLAE